MEDNMTISSSASLASYRAAGVLLRVCHVDDGGWRDPHSSG